MFVRIFKVRVDPSFRAEIERIEDEVCAWYVPAAGCLHVHFFGDPATGWYGNVAVWESRAAIDALAARPELATVVARLKPLLLEPPITEIYPVYVPKP